MSLNWTTAKLGDVIELQRGFDLPEQQRRPGTIPIVSSSGITGTHSEAKVASPGVVTGRYGTIGQVFYIREPFWPLNTTLFVKDFKGNDRRYVNYLLKTVDFDSCADKGAVPGVNRNDLHELPVDKAPLPEQQEIGRILGALDDKIELNRLMNRTLEAMAAALFKSWFVDFDPVVAKADGRQPYGVNAETAALFPVTFQDSELGPMPSGWQVVGVGSVMKNFDSKRVPLSGEQRAVRPGPFPYYGAASAMDHIDGYLFDGTYLLVAEDGSVSTDDDMAMTQYVWGKFWVNNHAHVLQGINGVSTEQLLLFFSSTQISPYITGAVQPKLNQANLNQIPFTLAQREITEAFGNAIAPLFTIICANVEEAVTLAGIRDALLPRLLTGEIRVKTAEREVGQAIAVQLGT